MELHEDGLKLLSVLVAFDFHAMHVPPEAGTLHQGAKHTDLAQESERLKEDPGNVEQLQAWLLPVTAR